jgi:cobalt-zinc-cadmium efflux system outer membrane protein
LVSSARLVLVSTLAQFRAAVGGVLPQDIELAGALDPPRALPPLQEVRQQALDRHPALALARSEVTRAEARLAYETALKRPQPFFRTEVDMTNPSYRFGFGVVLPAWNQRQGPIAEAEAARRQAAALAQARQIEIIAELEGAYGRYEVANQQIAQFEEGLLLEADEALRAAETAYQLGERGILEVLDAQRVLRAVRLGFLNAQYDRQAALVDLDELRAVDLRSNTP